MYGVEDLCIKVANQVWRSKINYTVTPYYYIFISLDYVQAHTAVSKAITIQSKVKTVILDVFLQIPACMEPAGWSVGAEVTTTSYTYTHDTGVITLNTPTIHW